MGCWSIATSPRLRFRCQIGHGFTADALDKEQETAVIEAVGVALRVLEERHTLLVKMADDAKGVDATAVSINSKKEPRIIAGRRTRSERPP